MKLKDVRKVDCEELDNYMHLGEIAAINALITDPEALEREFDYDREHIENLEDIINFTKSISDGYSDGHDEDYFGYHEIGTLENLLETEFHYICQENNDFIYLSAVLMHRIASGHPFQEGNKRTAYLAAAIFLITHQKHILGFDQVAIPQLDKDLLNSLEDIAISSKTIDPKQLANIYRESVEKELMSIIRSEAS